MTNSHHSLRPRIASATLVAQACLISLALQAWAVQAAEAPTPNAGSLLNEVRPVQPAAPAATPRILTPDAAAADGADSAQQGARFLLKRLVFTGNQALSTAQLQAHLQATFGTLEGSTVSMSQVRQMAASLTALYRSQGYPFSRVVVPQQDVTDGSLTLQAVEARLGKLQINNQGRIGDATLAQLGGAMQPGADITQDSLDRTLLLMSDLPGAQVQATIQPGTETGTSDLVVTHTTLPLFNARATLDNHGNRNISRARAGLALTWFNFSPVGDKASLDVITSGGGLAYARGAYERWLTGSGLIGGVQASHLNYRLGEELSALEANGKADTAGLWLRYPLQRTQRGSVFVQAGAEHLSLKDLVDSASVRNARTITRANVSINADRRGLLGGTGQTSGSVQITHGQVSFNDDLAQASDAATAQTKGSFSKLEWAVSHRQAFSPVDELLLSITGQQASKNLDSSQKWVIGGPGSVRAFDNSVASGDSGYTATAEWRRQVGAFHGPIMASVFYDLGHVRFNHKRWAAVTGGHDVTIAGLGVGLSWTGRNSAVALSLATPTTGRRDPAMQGARTGVLWVSAVFQF